MTYSPLWRKSKRRERPSIEMSFTKFASVGEVGDRNEMKIGHD